MSEDNKDNMQIDDESAKLLDEMEGATKPAPTKKKAAKAKAEPAPAPGNVVKNTSKNPRRIGGVTVKVGETYELTEQDLDDELLMQKIEYAITQGALSRVAD